MPPQSAQPTSCQLPVGPAEGQVEDPGPALGSGLLGSRSLGRGAAAAGLHPPQLPLHQQVLPEQRPRSTPLSRGWLRLPLVAAEQRPHAGGLPPRAGLHPVRDHAPHLPQPATPQELLGPLHPALRGPDPALSHLDGVVVPPHACLPANDSTPPPTPDSVCTDLPRTRDPAEAGVEVASAGMIEHVFEHRYGTPLPRRPVNGSGGETGRSREKTGNRRAQRGAAATLSAAPPPSWPPRAGTGRCRHARGTTPAPR